jgi:hypothetical protein
VRAIVDDDLQRLTQIPMIRITVSILIKPMILQIREEMKEVQYN